jgi:hypothetical protein
MANENKSRPRALVSGASSGIGLAFAERLAHDQYDLILVARNRERLEALAKKLRETEHVDAQVLVADLSQSSELRTVEDKISKDAALALLINNAGFGGYKPFATLEPERAEEQINLQVLAVTRLTRAALPGMIARGKGAIINVSSWLAFSGAVNEERLPKRAVYAATKSYINTFTQILANELEGTGVQVQALCPGVVLTEFHLRMGMDPSRFPAAIVSQPEDVVNASLAGLRLGEVICIPGLDDSKLLDQFYASQQQMFDRTGGGSVAKRFTE